MYMMLMIYAILNLHVVSWGTREVKKSAKEIEEEAARLEVLALKKKEEEARRKGLVFDIMDQVRKRASLIQPKKDYCTYVIC